MGFSLSKSLKKLTGGVKKGFKAFDRGARLFDPGANFRYDKAKKKAEQKELERQQNELVALQNQQAVNLKKNLSEDLGLDNTATVIAGGEGTLSEVEMLRRRRSPLAATLSSTLGIR